MDILEQIQERVMKMHEEMHEENLLCREEKLRELGLFSLEERRLRRTSVNVYKIVLIPL